MKTAILIYLLLGVLEMFILETFWDYLHLEDTEDMELSWQLRWEVIFMWPIPLFAAIASLLLGIEPEDDDNNDKNDKNNDDGPIKPGYGT